MYLLTREGFTKSALADYRDRKDATSRFMLAAIILHSDSVQTAIKREIRRVSEIIVDEAVIDKMLRDEVIKRETIEGDQADAASRRVLRSAEKSIRKGADKDENSLAAKDATTVPTGVPSIPKA